MLDKTLIAMIGLDIFIAVVLIMYGLAGFRRGGVKSFLSLLFLYIAFIISMILFEKPAVYLQVVLETKSSTARIVCFGIIFAIFIALTRYFYYLATKLFAQVLIRGIFSGIAGALFGIMEGILIIGIIYMCIGFYPVTPPLSETMSFRVIKDIPVEIRDSSLWFLPSMKDSLAQKEAALKEKAKQDSLKEKEYGDPGVSPK
jgi:uncharacterized membrane protein required for colicin V production